MVALYSWTNLVNSNSCVFIVALESFHPLDEGKARKLHPIFKKSSTDVKSNLKQSVFSDY